MSVNKIDELMNLIYLYGDACEQFGGFNCDRNAERCDEIARNIKLFLKENFQERKICYNKGTKTKQERRKENV